MIRVNLRPEHKICGIGRSFEHIVYVEGALCSHPVLPEHCRDSHAVF
jgi:hypothetical protein